MAEQGAHFQMLTPDSLPTTFSDFMFNAPDEWFPYLIGALNYLSKVESWEQSAGGWTPEETASFFGALVSIWVDAEVCP